MHYIHLSLLLLSDFTTYYPCCSALIRPIESLIVWTEPNGADYALSFQDAEGCAEVWNFIIEVQRHLNSGGQHRFALSPRLVPFSLIFLTNAYLIRISPRRSGHWLIVARWRALCNHCQYYPHWSSAHSSARQHTRYRGRDQDPFEGSSSQGKDMRVHTARGEPCFTVLYIIVFGHMLTRMQALHQGPYRCPEHGRRPREPRQPACSM